MTLDFLLREKQRSSRKNKGRPKQCMADKCHNTLKEVAEENKEAAKMEQLAPKEAKKLRNSAN